MNSEKLALLLTREMPYGKYKGRKIADLPGHYLGWFAREGFPSGELGALIALMYELDQTICAPCSIRCGDEIIASQFAIGAIGQFGFRV